MSFTLFRQFASSVRLRQNLARHPFKTVLQIRRITAMETASVDNKETQEKTSEKNLVLNKNLTRFKKRYMKRQWEDANPAKKENGETDEKKLCEAPAERIKRKKMVLLLGYCGVDYYGMQRNPGVRTIEEELLTALRDAKYITEVDFHNQQNAQFQRSSRTDKGVSAARQIVSLKLPLEANIDEINKRLPESIRVFGMKRVTNRFNSKSKCNARTYSYTLPTYVLEPSLLTEEERKQYRVTPEKLEQLGKVLGVYKGTKSYHNFTEKKHFQDPSALRYMMGFTVEKVFVDSDMEFAVLLVKGQSFMLHQIRKMVGLAIAVLRGHADMATVEKAFGKDKVILPTAPGLGLVLDMGQSFMLHQIRKMVGLAIAVLRGHADMATVEKAFGKDKVILPTAPGLGLVLDMVHYDRYDAKFKSSHDSLTWTSEEEAIQKFKHKHIYPVIVKGELLENSMGQWLEKLSMHSYEPNEENQKVDDKGLAGGDDDDDGDGDGDGDKSDDERHDEKSKEEDGIPKSASN